LISHKEGVTPRKLKDDSIYRCAFGSQNKPLEAADAYLDYADHYGGDPNAARRWTGRDAGILTGHGAGG